MFGSRSQKNQTVLVNEDGSVRINLDNPKVRENILKQVQLAREMARRDSLPVDSNVSCVPRTE